MRLKDKVAVITGGASGMGRATARLFAKEGAKVLLADMNEKAGNEVAEEINKEGGIAAFVRIDVGKYADGERLVRTCIDLYGRIDILFNNAGVPGESLQETTREKWQRVLDVNLTGPYFITVQAIPYMKRQGGGRILFNASAGALKAGARSPSYGASKGALLVLARTFSRILAKDNILVNCICPGSIETGLTNTDGLINVA